jgi:hypothetical protein
MTENSSIKVLLIIFCIMTVFYAESGLFAGENLSVMFVDLKQENTDDEKKDARPLQNPRKPQDKKM